MKVLIKNILVISIIGFILQYIWEYLQCGIFYTMPNKSPSTLMISATLGDVAITILLYIIIALSSRRFSWITHKWDLKEITIMILYSLFVSFYFESSALYTGRWSYARTMPLFFNTNIGLIPVLQLLILLPLTFFISRVLLKQLNLR